MTGVEIGLCFCKIAVETRAPRPFPAFAITASGGGGVLRLCHCGRAIFRRSYPGAPTTLSGGPVLPRPAKRRKDRREAVRARVLWAEHARRPAKMNTRARAKVMVVKIEHCLFAHFDEQAGTSAARRSSPSRKKYGRSRSSSKCKRRYSTNVRRSGCSSQTADEKRPKSAIIGLLMKAW